MSPCDGCASFLISSKKTENFSLLKKLMKSRMRHLWSSMESFTEMLDDSYTAFLLGFFIKFLIMFIF